MNTLNRRTLAFACALLTGAGIRSQDNAKLPKWRIDPYTKNDPELMAKLGYESYGPFPFGQKGDTPVDTTEVDAHLSYEEILWVETKHFRIGSMLDKWSVPTEPTVKKKLRAELERFKERCGNDSKIKVKPRSLDRWLRLHLTAQRMEDHYALLQDWLGVTDADFPKSPDSVMIGQARYMGMGPFLGQTGKYLLLISESGGSMTDYLKNFTGRDTQQGQRWNYKVVGSLLYAIATEWEDNRLKHDTALHGNLVFNVTHNTIDGYRFYAYETPVWIKVGLAHYFERLISERWNTFDSNEGSPADMKNTWRWDIETRKLLTSGKFAPFAEMYAWRDYGQIKFRDQVAIWSRWDFILSQGKEKFSKYMLEVKGRIDPKTYIPNDEGLVDATRLALQSIYGLSPLSFDERWAEWVRANYATN